MHHPNVDITSYVNLNLVAEWEDRYSTVLRVAQKSGDVFLWAELVVDILNAAIREGATQALIENTILEMPGDLDGLYEWLLSTLTAEEKVKTLALFQWVILASEPMRLNDLATAIGVTPSWEIAEMRPENALALSPSIRSRQLSASPRKFQRWLKVASFGLLEVRPGESGRPLGLQQVYVIHESVRSFFLSGRGFAALDKNNETTLYSHSWSEQDLADVSHYVLLNVCINFLNMKNFDCIDNLTISMQGEGKYRRAKQHDQRHLILSSYPFLQYAADNLLYHMLSPRLFRYHLPQQDILNLFAAENCRLWKRWTFLIGVESSEPEAALATSAKGTAGRLLDPIYGARYRLERVFRRVNKMKIESRHVQEPSYSSFDQPSPTIPPELPRKLKSCLKVDTRPSQPPVAMVTPSPDQRTSYTSTNVPSIFSPPGSPMSIYSLMSPLSILEATFEAAKEGMNS